MTAYDDFRDNAYLSELDSDIDAFIARYNSHNPAQRKTVFLFPGGMASQLKRSWFPNIAGNYASLWLDCPALVGGTTFLQLHSALEDYLRCAIVPDGNVEFFGVDPYKDFIDWCRNNGIDVFVFGWDWRRPGKASANLFLKKFIAKFTSIVAQYAPHALDNVYLIGHSFGGIVIKHMMNDFNDPFVANKVKLAITVATPFYGYAGHLPRFFKGDENLNFTQGLDGAREMTRIISTMPAGYEVLFLSEELYDNNSADFASDPDGYHLTHYPSVDKDNIHERADPYKPVPGKSVTTGKVRYIRSLGFNWDHLANAKAAAAEVASPLDQSVKNKFWNIRVVQHDGVEDKAETAVGHVWRRVQASTFSPTLSPSPIGAWMGPGDGTLPAWSTRLLGHTNLRTLKGDMNHAFAMNSAQTHAAIGQLLGMPPAQMMVRQESEMEKPQIASREELTNLLKKLRRNSDAPRFNFSDLIARFGIERARAFIKRAFVDALKYQGPIVEKPKFADEIQTPEKRKK